MINKGDIVVFSYIIRSENGELLESNLYKLSVGHNYVNPIIDRMLLDSSYNEIKSINVASKDFFNSERFLGEKLEITTKILDHKRINYDNLLLFDIGFNHGNFSKQILNFNPNCKIVGVDAHPMYEDLFKNNPLNNTTFLCNAISDKLNEEISFFICDSNPGINSINEEWTKTIRHSSFFENTKREVKVNSLTLEYLVLKYGIPDILKLDIEGAESIALSGLKTKCKQILFEFAEEWYSDTVKCIEIRELGYEYIYCDLHMEGDPIYTEYNTNFEYVNIQEFYELEDIIPERKLKHGMIYVK